MSESPLENMACYADKFSNVKCRSDSDPKVLGNFTLFH